MHDSCVVAGHAGGAVSRLWQVPGSASALFVDGDARLLHPDREVIDESINSIGKGANVPDQRLRRALSNIAGSATIVGQAGVPLIEGIRNVTKAWGCSTHRGCSRRSPSATRHHGRGNSSQGPSSP
jgi:hypothetical protein